MIRACARDAGVSALLLAPRSSAWERADRMSWLPDPMGAREGCGRKVLRHTWLLYSEGLLSRTNLGLWFLSKVPTPASFRMPPHASGSPGQC